MGLPPPDRPPSRTVVKSKQRRAESERSELLEHLQALTEPLMVGLGLVFLVLLLIDFADPGLRPDQRTWLDRATAAIWVVFLIDFTVRFVVAPAKLRYLRQNWLGAVSLALPFIRPLAAFRALRGLRALRAVRSLNLVRLLGGVNRGMRLLRRVTRGRQLVYVAALTLFVVLAGAAGAFYFDRGISGAPIQSFGDALWWSATLMTTVNSERYVVSPEARVIALLLRLFAVSVFGLVTAAIASYFVDRDAEARGESPPETEVAALRAEMADLRRQGLVLSRELAATRAAIARLLAAADAPPAAAGATGSRPARPDRVSAAGREAVAE